jgi:hypothetical protein
MDYLLKLDNCAPPCWINLDAKGDPQTTTDRNHATVFETENLARENKTSIEAEHTRYALRLIVEPVV